MAKIKKTPQDFGVTIPSTPPITVGDSLDDEDDDEMFEALSDEGLAPATDDLTVLDFFAGMVASKMDGDSPESIAIRSYQVARALCRQRAAENEQ